jgi:hypothetical protein
MAGSEGGLIDLLVTVRFYSVCLFLKFIEHFSESSLSCTLLSRDNKQCYSCPRLLGVGVLYKIFEQAFILLL